MLYNYFFIFHFKQFLQYNSYFDSKVQVLEGEPEAAEVWREGRVRIASGVVTLIAPPGTASSA